MCGLILAPASVSPALIEKAMGMMSYRGKDGHSGMTQGFGWTLGHVRLAIQDLSSEGRQPFIDGYTMTAFVGEFFNHGGWGEKEYLSQLLHREDFHGADGFWSVAQVTAAGARVYTDHLGIKPLYWWPQYNLICSELEPMFAIYPRPAFDETYLSNCVKFGYDYSGLTPYQGIRQLAPGSRLFLSPKDEEISVRQYWDWSKVPPPQDFRAALDRAIENRLIGDRPVALLLSGGLDSSIIYYSLKEMGRQVEAFSIENGETEYLPDGVRFMKLEDFPIQEAVQIMQAPLDLGSLVPQIQLARAVQAKGYNVVMTGDGADELFGGYRRAAEYDSQASDVFCELPYYHLPRLDRVMMRSTIELRSPFLAPSVVSAALHTRWPDRTSKQVLKRSYLGTVPLPILERGKHPLKTPAVIEGGHTYRQRLVEEFRNVPAYL